MTAKPATPKKLLSDSLSDHTLDHPASKRLTIGDTIYDLADHTPMMVQYLTMKANYPQALLLYRMGDFYELFFEDAKRAAQILDITLTRRGTDKAGHTIAMAGVPFHAADSYMARLIAAGQTVVVCEQIDESAPSQLPTMGAKSNKQQSQYANKDSATDSANPANKPTGIMRREVVKTLTAGTITDDALIAPNHRPTVVAIDIAAPASKAGSKRLWQAAISQLDLAAGTLTTQTLSSLSTISTTTDSVKDLQQQMLTVLARFAPSECIVSEALIDRVGEEWMLWLRSHLDCPIIEVAANDFYRDHAATTLCQQFDVQRLDGLGILDAPLSQTSCAALIHYARQTQQRHVPQVNQLIVEHHDDYLIIDANSQQNLELFSPVSVNGTSLISVVNHCKTPMGRRLLVQQMQRPLRQHSRINQRLEAITSLLKNQQALSNDKPSNIRGKAAPSLVQNLRQTLNSIGDIERISSRIALMSAKPRDLRKLADGIANCEPLSVLLSTIELNPESTSRHSCLLTSLIQQLPAQLPVLQQTADLIERAILVEPPAHIRDGGMLAIGFDEEFDRLSHLHDNIQTTLDEMVEQQRQSHQLTSLKVGFNRVSGFYFELPKMQAQHAPAHFIRRQTLKNSERFITDELKEVETEYLEAQTLALAREKELYQQLLITLNTNLAPLQQLSAALAQLDVLTNWAQLACTYNWQRPLMTNDSLDKSVALKNSTASDQQNQINFDQQAISQHQLHSQTNSNYNSSSSSQTSIDIVAGRHLVVEAALNPTSTSLNSIDTKFSSSFVANDCRLGSPSNNDNGHTERLLLITGPNMGGKSTYMRQTALIVLLAHCGSFVPAASARIGDIDRIFTRIGSADDLAGGKSTFMVEMIETANILNQATNKSLVLMDEVGRGTATTDGLAIAHACVNKLLAIGCLTLFATHYFELTQLADLSYNDQANGIRNVHVAASDVDGQLLLLHQIRDGAASSSFGLHVAKMAGIPAEVLADAKRYLVDNLTVTDNSDKSTDKLTHKAAIHVATADNKNDLANSLNDQSRQSYALSEQKTASNTPQQAVLDDTNNQYNQLLALHSTLDNTDPDALTPKQAHDLLYKLKQLIRC